MIFINLLKFNPMRIFIAILLFFVLSVRSVLPVIDYAVNYDYIATQLCENKSRPELLCNGKCYVKKELAKSSQNQNSKELKVEFLDVFPPVETLSVLDYHKIEFSEKRLISLYYSFSFQECFSEVFHPPTV